MTVNVDRLRGAMYAKKVSVTELAKLTGINETTLYRRFANPDQFLYKEVMNIKNALGLSQEETDFIFMS